MLMGSKPCTKMRGQVTTIFFYIYRASFKYMFKQIIFEVSFMVYISYGPHPIRTTFGVGASSKLDGSHQ